MKERAGHISQYERNPFYADLWSNLDSYSNVVEVKLLIENVCKWSTLSVMVV